MDPFCGIGTTLIEAKLQNISSIGMEANPFAHFSSTVKIDWDIDKSELHRIATEIKESANIEIEKQGISDTPSLKNLKVTSLKYLHYRNIL